MQSAYIYDEDGRKIDPSNWLASLDAMSIEEEELFFISSL